jgi:energy-coupling factor transporter ATP-binding protein EcfA2
VILKRARLESFRCFAEPFELDFDERVTVVCGPNGAGKSTLLTALERALFDRPDGTSSDLEALMPWGTDVAPRVTLEFSTGGADYRLEKSFGSRGQTRLAIVEDGRPRALSEGSAAVEWVRERLGGRSPGRGPSKPEHRGIAQLLFMPQGSLEWPERIGEGAMERLRAVVGQAVIDPATRSIEEQLARRYDELYTEKTGQPKRGAPLATREEELARARAELEAARAAWRRLDELRGELESANDAAAALDKRTRALEAEQERLKPLAAERRKLVERREQARREHEAAERAFAEIAERIRRVAELRARARELEARVASHGALAEGAQAALAEARRARDVATAQLKAHEAARGDVNEARRLAEDARAFERARAEQAETAPRLEGFRAAQAEVEQIERALAARPAPTGKRIGELRRAIVEERSAREQLEALRLRVKVRALKPVELAAPDGAASLAAGEEREWSGEGALALTVGDSLAIAISGPTADVPRARAEHERRRAALDALAAELGSAAPEELEKRREAREELEKALAAARARRVAFLPRDSRAGDAPVSTLERRLEAAREAISAIAARRSSWSAEPPDAAALADRARAAEDAFDAELRRLGEAEGLARAEAERALMLSDERRELLQRAREEHEGVAGELRAASADGRSDGEREELRRRESARAQRAEDQLALAERDIAAIAGDPEAELERAAASARALVGELRERQKRLGQAEQALADAAAGAPYSRLAEHEERAAVLADEVARARRESEAIKLLHDLFADERARTAQRLVEPVIARVLPRLRALAGPRVEGVALDESWRPRTVQLGGVEAPVASLSFGTRDQLAVLMRLALGELAAGDERLPAVLDDPLVHADPERMHRFLALLAESSERLQLIVLTCRPDDYRGLERARLVTLAEPPPPIKPAAPAPPPSLFE